MQVKADWAAKSIPANYFMFDSWWYQKDGDPAPSKNSSHPWPVRTSGGVIEWVPEGVVFESGLTDWLGAPTFLHNRAFSTRNRYLNDSRFKDSFICDENLCLPTDEALFGHILDVVKPWQPFVYEQDWISKVMNDVNGAWTTDVTAGHRWLKAMGDAAQKRNITIQYSMTETPAILHSSTVQAVTQIRASGDYACGSGQWKVGETAFYYWALGVVGSKDTYWTTRHQPGCPKAGSYNCTEPNVEIQTLMAVLSGGPVGPGDRLAMTDPVLAMRTCTAEGKITRPDRPLAPLDIVFSRDLNSRGNQIVWSSFSEHGDHAWHYLFAAELREPVHVFPQDLLTTAASDTDFVAVLVVGDGSSWPATAVGTATTGSTIHFVNATSPLVLPASTNPGPSPGPSPSPAFKCADTSSHTYCEFPSVYCDGSGRKEFHHGTTETLAQCQAACDADAACNCFSWAAKPRSGEQCRAYEKASKLTQSGSGYSAYIKPQKQREAQVAAAPGTTGFSYWVLAPVLHEYAGFVIIGELGKAVPTSSRRFTNISAAAAAAASSVGSLPAATDFVVGIHGKAGEHVELAYVPPGGTKLASVTCVIGLGGAAQAKCAATACTC
jgi:hypothetical protein